MDACAVHERHLATGHDFFQESFGFFKFVLLHGARSSLIVLHSLCKSRVFLEYRFLRRDWWFLPRHRRSIPKGLCYLWFSRRTFNTSCHFFLHSVISSRPESKWR